MARPSKSSPERATQGESKNIPIEDANGAAQASQPTEQTTHSGGDATSSASAAAVPTDPSGSAAGGEDAKDASLEGEPVEPEVLSADEQVAKAQAEAKEWQDKFMRLHAEWDTYRRRTTEQRTTEKARATEKLVTSLLPVIDDFERTIDYATKNGEAGLFDGVKAVHTKLVSTLTKDGVEVLDPAGEAFDALEAQAVATIDDASVPDETVAEVFQRGYKMGTKVLRPAMVTVTTGGPKREKSPDEGVKEK